MTSLAEAYERRVGEVADPRRLYLGVGLFFAGVALTAAGIVVATTDVLSALGVDRMAAWRRAGVLGGIGVPATIAGVFTVLPSSRRIKAAATIGASVSVLGVALFWHAYPTHWAGYGQDLTGYVVGVYFLGTATSVWCLFAGIATLKRRNDPGGTVSLKITKDGETKVIEVDRDQVSGMGGVGVAGADLTSAVGADDAEVTRANEASTGSTGKATADRSSSGAGTSAGTAGASAGTADAATGAGGSTADRTTPASAGAASDGGRQDREITSLQGETEIVDTGTAARQHADRYCGNCEHFRYVRSGQGMQPYCGFHGETMDDMEACEEWEPNH